MEAESHPRRGEQVLARQAADSLVLLDPKSGEYFSLDGVGARIWELCDGTRSVEEITDVITSEYGEGRSTVESDVRELLGDLASERLVVDVGSPS
jgi:hypothetical protein